MYPVVSIVKTVPSPGEKEIDAAVRKAVELAGGFHDIIKPGDLVLVNPNLVAVPPRGVRSGVVTLKEVVKTIADILSEMGANPVIAESSSAGIDTEIVFKAAGYDILRDKGYKVVDLKKEKVVTLKVPNGIEIDEVKVYELVQKADAIISVPVMKTHDNAEVSLSLKNLKGLIPDNTKKDFHRKHNIFKSVPDLASAIKPVFAIVDGIFAQEGLGPVFGKPVEMDIIIAGKDLVAVDSITAEIMEVGEHELFLEQYACQKGLGVIDRKRITVVGEKVSSVKRKFLRGSEDVIIVEPSFRLIFEEGTCTGCRNAVLSSLNDIKKDNLTEHLKNKTVIAGMCERLPEDCNPENLVIVGACLYDKKEKGTFVKGCPPNNSWIIKSIVGDKKA